MATKNIPEFGKKLDHLAGILGHRFPSRKFIQARLADELDIDKTVFTRMRNGDRGISEDILARVIAAFGLQHHGITYEDFYLSLDRFKQQMRESNVGLHGDVTADQARQHLGQMSLIEKDIPDGLRVSVSKADTHRRGGGIGMDLPTAVTTCEFQTGDLAVVSIHVPQNGFLLVFNDQVGIELTVLLPSIAAPVARVKQGELVLPNADHIYAFPVGAPSSAIGNQVLYRIVVVWTATPTNLHSHLSGFDREQLERLSYFELANLVSELNVSEAKTWRAANCDYYVKLNV